MFQKTDDAFCVRTKDTGDKVYLVQEGKKWWIRNPETLSALGFKFGDEKTIEPGDFAKLEYSGFIDMKNEVLEENVQKEYTKTPVDKKPLLNYRKEA